MPLRMRYKAVNCTPGRVLVFLALLLECATPLRAAENYYRWQDSEGNHHYSDTLPENAENSQTLQLTLQRPLYAVEKVIDGDTITVEGAGKVRLLGINTPEVANRTHRAEDLGDEAHQRLTKLLSGKRVTLLFDQQHRDRYDRLLAHVTREDGLKINELLLAEGLARALFLQPNMLYLQRYYGIEAEAREAGRGIWSLPEYRLRPASQAGECSKRFCRLHGKVKRVVKKRYYTYLSLPGNLLVAIHHEQLTQFQKAGIDISKVRGKDISVRGWIGTREGKLYLRLHHPQQILLTPL